MKERKVSVLFVCLGNICRSPLAEAVFRKHVEEAGLVDRFEIDSAGTSGYHDGERPDQRTIESAQRRGVGVRGTARSVTERDLRHFDYVIAMDGDNLTRLRFLAMSARATPRLHLMREFDPESWPDAPVPDPYFGGPSGFDEVHDIVERASHGLLAHLRTEHKL